MKFASVLVLATASSAAAFAPTLASQPKQQATALSVASDNRRAFLNKFSSAAAAFAVGQTLLSAPESALAIGYGQEYTPKFDDIKVIANLAASLDKLMDAIANNQGKALEGLGSYYKSPDFYVGFARNFISKTKHNDADGDPRMALIRQVRS